MSVIAIIDRPNQDSRIEEMPLYRELDRILSQRLLTPLFMPIVNSQEKHIIGYEALIRGPSTSSLYAPTILFKTAHTSGRLLDLERLCRETSICRFKQLNLQGKLFLNVSPASLLQNDFKSGMTLEFMHQIGLDPDRVVIEITEQFPIEDYALMKDATEHYSQLGFEVALDDLGAGYAGLRSWAELRPQYVKIDRHFIEGLDRSPIKQEFVRSIIDVARSIRCKVIAEGIERVEEHMILNQFGLELQQGFYFARPLGSPPTQLNPELFRTHTTDPICDITAAKIGLNSITHFLPALNEQASLAEALTLFRQHPQHQAIAVVKDDRPIGLLRWGLCQQLVADTPGQQFQPIGVLIDSQPLILERCLSLNQLRIWIRQCDPAAARSDFIVTRKGLYLGIASIFDLLKLLAELPQPEIQKQSERVLLNATLQPTTPCLSFRAIAE